MNQDRIDRTGVATHHLRGPLGRLPSIGVGILIGLTLAWAGASASQPAGGGCGENGQCPPNSFCQKAVGDCDGVGACMVKPLNCPVIFAPVCGCDGTTYLNACEAAKAGVNVQYAGECLPAKCTDNGACPPDSYCKKAIGDCNGDGLCVEKPELCPDVYVPVCGCNGVTYSNACEAAKAGVNVSFDGACRWVCVADINNDGVVDGADLAIVLGNWGPCP